MQATRNFSPIAPDEVENLAIDFVNDLSTGDSIQSVMSWSCSVAPESLVPDTAPASRLLGAPALSGTLVTQGVYQCLAGVTYLMECVVNTTQGEKLSIWARLPCVGVGQ